MIYIYLLPST